MSNEEKQTTRVQQSLHRHTKNLVYFSVYLHQEQPVMRKQNREEVKIYILPEIERKKLKHAQTGTC